MNDTRRVALWGGLAYLATFLFSLPAVALLTPATGHADYVLGTGSDDPPSTRCSWAPCSTGVGSPAGARR